MGEVKGEASLKKRGAMPKRHGAESLHYYTKFSRLGARVIILHRPPRAAERRLLRWRNW